MTDYEKLSREHFDSMAENYAATDGTYYSRLPRAASDEAAAILRRIGFGSLLDVGCGSGYLISVLAAERKDAEFYGLDRKSTRLNSSHSGQSRMPSSA